MPMEVVCQLLSLKFYPHNLRYLSNNSLFCVNIEYISLNSYFSALLIKNTYNNDAANLYCVIFWQKTHSSQTLNEHLGAQLTCRSCHEGTHKISKLRTTRIRNVCVRKKITFSFQEGEDGQKRDLNQIEIEKEEMGSKHKHAIY